MAAERDRVALVAFLATSVLAGGNAVGIRFSNRELAPLWGAGLRFSLATLVLWAIVAARRFPLPRGRALVGAILFGLINFGLNYALAYYALVRLHAGLAQTLLALVPLATLMLAVIEGQERLRLASVVGTLLALAGVAVISGLSLGETLPVLSLLAALGAVACFAQASILVRAFPPVHPVTMNALAMAVGAAFLLIASRVAGQPWEVPDRAATWLAVVYLVLVGSVVVFVLFLVVLKYWEASRVAYGFVITPIITVLLSAWLDDEPIRLGLVFGGLLILAGVYVGALRPARVPAAPAEPVP
jgi:drug/metabolite transporter (DMT)-like permease